MTFDLVASREACTALPDALDEIERLLHLHEEVARDLAVASGALTEALRGYETLIDNLNARIVTAEEGAEIWSERLVEMTGERDRLLVEVGNLERRLAAATT